jgi:hypothetical protein
MEIVEPVILQARTPPPTYIPIPSHHDRRADVGHQSGRDLDISSVYDFDGVDTAKPNIATQCQSRPGELLYPPARFVRIEKAVEIPAKTVRKINHRLLGPAGMGMREILGYAPIQPDGSVQIQVPANVPFTIDVSTRMRRRITAQHTSWLQLMPGETKSCNGCHSTAGNLQTTSHGRSGLTVRSTREPRPPASRFPTPIPRYSPMPARPWRKRWRGSAARAGAALPCLTQPLLAPT